LPEASLGVDPLTYASYIAGITHDPHSKPGSLIEMGALLTFCLVWPWNVILFISASRVAGIIDVRHCALPESLYS
jgi:hypothetical protein